MFQSLQSDLSSIKSIKILFKGGVYIFQFSHIAASSALLHHSNFLQNFIITISNFLSRMTSSLLQTRPGRWFQLHYLSQCDFQRVI